MLWHENVHGELLPFSSTSICPPSTLSLMCPAKLKFLYVNYCQAARQPQECALNLASFVQPDYSLCHKTVRWTIENQLTESVAVLCSSLATKSQNPNYNGLTFFGHLGTALATPLSCSARGVQGKGWLPSIVSKPADKC